MNRKIIIKVDETALRPNIAFRIAASNDVPPVFLEYRLPKGSRLLLYGLEYLPQS